MGRESAVLSSGSSGDAVIYAYPCKFYGMTIIGDGTNDNGVALAYDHASAASGTLVGSLKTTKALSNSTPGLSLPVNCSNGIYLNVTNSTAIVYYAPGGTGS